MLFSLSFFLLDKAQVVKISACLEGSYSVQISTVDAFQGAERDVIILSTSRTARLGFSDSPKRLNVAITRARRHLIIMGSAPLLTSNTAWDTVLATALSSAGGLQSCSRIISSGQLELTSEKGCSPKSKSSAVIVVAPTTAKTLKNSELPKQCPQEESEKEYLKKDGGSALEEDSDEQFFDDLDYDELFN